MKNQSLKQRSLILLKTVGWALLVTGLLLVWNSTLENFRVTQVTPHSLAWSSTGLALLLLGTCLKSCRKQQMISSNPAEASV